MEKGRADIRKWALWGMAWILTLLTAVPVFAETELRLVLDTEELVTDDPLFVENNRLYIPVRVVSEHLGGRVEWHPDVKQVEVTSALQDHIVFTLQEKEVKFNGDTYSMDVRPLMRNNRTYLPARHVGEMLHAQVRWNRENNSVTLAPVLPYEAGEGETLGGVSAKLGIPADFLGRRNDADGIYLEKGTKVKIVIPQIMTGVATANNSEAESVDAEDEPEYTAEELELLARIIHAEAGYEGLEGQIAVGNVVLNRVEDERFPDTIRDVIYQPGQFTPAEDGTLETLEPNESSYLAAEMVLEGKVVAEGALYFFNPERTRHPFFTSKEVVAEIGSHRFVK